MFFVGRPFSGPCIAQVSRSDAYSIPKIYGPFPSLKECKVWINLQYHQGFRGSFSISPIMTPYRVRSHEDWWMSDQYRKEEDVSADYPKRRWFKLNKWKRWLRNTSDIYYKAYMNKPIDFDDLPENVRLYYIGQAFDSLVNDDEVPYEVMTGDEDTWDNYEPAIEMARKNYEDEISLN